MKKIDTLSAEKYSVTRRKLALFRAEKQCMSKVSAEKQRTSTVSAENGHYFSVLKKTCVKVHAITLAFHGENVHFRWILP
jgi:hypothetical protein